MWNARTQVSTAQGFQSAILQKIMHTRSFRVFCVSLIQIGCCMGAEYAECMEYQSLLLFKCILPAVSCIILVSLDDEK